MKNWQRLFVIMNERIIISMTSYPARIQYVAKVWFTILKQMQPEYNCHCILVLAKPEFPNKEKDLPQDLLLLINSGKVELMWTTKNTLSHKKLIPTLLKYPNNPILIIDDDQYRTPNWLKTFIDYHRKYPTEVLTGITHFILQDGIFYRRTLMPGKYDNARPANGRGGTLYPPGIFTDKEFFDESLYMKLSPTSDESWQFYFMKKHKIPVRLIPYENDTHLVISEAQKMKTALWSVNNFGRYNVIWKTINDYFGTKL